MDLGAEIDFRAEHEYRTIDPRPRGIATDLTLRIGLARAYGNYNMGAGIGMRTYKQTNNVDFYNPLGRRSRIPHDGTRNQLCALCGGCPLLLL